MSKITVDTVEPATGTSLTLGASGDTITVPSGATLTNNGTITNSGTATGFGLFSSYAIIADQKAQNTAGGTFTLGAWRTRDLNTEIADPDGIVSISTNQFTLGAGSYFIRWVCPCYQVEYQQSRLYNITDSSVGGIGDCNYVLYYGLSQGSTRVVIAGSKTFEIQHRSASTYATQGFGAAANFGTEQYTLVEIFKEA